MTDEQSRKNAGSAKLSAEHYAGAYSRVPLAISVAEFGRITSLGRTKTFELLKRGVLRSQVIGRRRLILWSSVEELLADGEVR